METAKKIIVVDDEKRICHNVEKILKKNNYEVTRAQSAEEALEKMARESFSLLISDIVMPGQNGLELLKLVKKEWPLTRAIMMTAYASTDTAMKAIRLGALDYIPKPFTPDELRNTVEKALNDELPEAETTAEEREFIDAIDIDIPFDAEEVAQYTSEEYAKMLGPSDMPVVEVKMPSNLENYCEIGEMVCDIYKKLGATCKAGTKTSLCPQKKAKKKKTAAKTTVFDSKNMIGIDQPFNYQEVVSITGPEYIQNLHHEGVAFVPYEELKKNVARMLQPEQGRIDVDMPFDRDEVKKYTGGDYVKTLSRSDVPVVEITSETPPENFCEVGNMVCDIFKKLGATCKAGTKTSLCPQKKAKKKKAATKAPAIEFKKLIGIDLPFNFEDVAAVTGPEYALNLQHDGVSQIPYEVLKAKMAPPRQEKAEAPTVEKYNFDLLIVDDEVTVNNNIRKILSKKDYSMEQAVSKEEALEKINTHRYHVVLLDLRIPGVKGLELLSAIRVTQPQAKVIIITGYASIETAVQAARIGAVDYLPKPFTPDEIRSVTDKAILMAA